MLMLWLCLRLGIEEKYLQAPLLDTGTCKKQLSSSFRAQITWKCCASTASTSSVPRLKPTSARALPWLWNSLVLGSQLWLQCYPAVLLETPVDTAFLAAQALEPVPPLTSLELLPIGQPALPSQADAGLPLCQRQPSACVSTPNLSSLNMCFDF